MGGLYNVLFGQNRLAPLLCRMLDLKAAGNDGGKYDVYRYRDCYLNDDGTVIVLYTRGGGNNRACDCCGDGQHIPGSQHGEDCTVAVQGRLRRHPCYIGDYDDDFDNTYAYFEFSVPEEFRSECADLARGSEPMSPTEKFQGFIEQLQMENEARTAARES